MGRLIKTFAFLHILTFTIGKTPDNKTIASYDPSELLEQIFKQNDSMPRVRFGSEQFEDDNIDDNDYFHKETVKFKDDSDINYSEISSDEIKQNSFVNFQDYNKDDLKKRRRRKRKPRQQYYGLQNLPIRPDLAQYNGIPNSGYGGQYYRPPRPRPSIASDALSAVTDALTSIALYDDQQCVPRLLCEAAGGGTLGSSGILQTLSGIQPLLTLLSAYNGISSNPLFVFGRAVFLGMSSNGNTASCRYAYPSCPTDPEQLIYYLNNHNGGFFRFFNSPQQGQQNVEEFYNQLTQNYGLPQQGQPQNGYGFYDPNLAQNYSFHKPNLYQGHGQQNYGLAFPYGNNNIRFKNSDKTEILKDKVQRRIQNNPTSQDFVDSGDFNTKWMFPETVENGNTYYINNDVYKYNDYYKDNVNSARDVDVFKFPDSNQESVTGIQGYDRKIRGFTFPESISNTHYNDYKYLTNDAYNNKFVYNNNYYQNQNKYVYNGNNNADDLRGVTTVYVVRGNGDPRNPEIIKLRPGETIH